MLILTKNKIKGLLNMFLSTFWKRKKKMTIRIAFRSGDVIYIKCDGFSVEYNRSNMKCTGYEITGIADNKPLFLDMTEITSIIEKI
jgi:hypothetical protein